ncbi:unnamed protein product, partial [Symbiodinium microadriaticum]
SPQLHLFGTGIACMSLAAMGLFSSESLLWQVQTVASAMDTEASTHLLPLALGSSAIGDSATILFYRCCHWIIC